MCLRASEEKFRSLPAAYSHLYLCIAGELAAVICIYDPLRKEAADAVRALHACGIDKVVMMTGDNRKTAEAVAAQVGVDEVYAEVLPEDKAAFIRAEKAAGRTVIMIGDGVNDSPALSEADAGIAISTGAAIAREIADITIASEDLFELVTLRTSFHRADGAYPPQLPVHRELQLLADRSGRRGHSAADHVGTAAQHVDPRHQPQEHDEPSARAGAGTPIIRSFPPASRRREFFLPEHKKLYLIS